MNRPEPLPQRHYADTAEIPAVEIHHRLEQGRMEVQATEDGSRLAWKPEMDRRQAAEPHPEGERRTGREILHIPTRFPEQGPILCLLVGGWADDRALLEPVPFWRDDAERGFLIWQALLAAGLIHRKDQELALGQGGFWDEEPPRTQGLAMTYAAYRRRDEPADFDAVVSPWNLRRLQSLVVACRERSMGRLHVVTVGEAARFLMCGVSYGMADIPVLSLPEPLQAAGGDEDWIEFAADLLRA